MNKSNVPDEAKAEMRQEYDFRGGARGKHAKAMQAGYTVTIRNADGTVTTQQVEPRKGTVILEPDVLAYFPDSASVNHALRTLITLFPDQAVEQLASRQS
ncbi:MAG: hypothetical protein R3A44_00900 [Caldilineaceae bacterium]